MAEEFEGPVTILGKLELKSNGFKPGNLAMSGGLTALGVTAPTIACSDLEANTIIRGPNVSDLRIVGRVPTDRARLVVGGAIVAEDGIEVSKATATELHVAGPIVARQIMAEDISVSGDIRLEQADCAEDFTLAAGVQAEPGSVMVLEQDGTLVPCNHAYDSRVVGVISGAGHYRPSIVMDRRQSDNPHPACNRHPIALLGKVFCNVDTSYGAIAVGDLLTTSGTSGHAMKASDSSKAFGSIIGKALQPLEAGRGQVPILVTLQ